jgi:hypothetical protein
MPLRAHLAFVAAMCLCSCKFADVPLLDEDAASDPDASVDAPNDAPDSNVTITSGPAGNATTGPHVVFEFTVADGEPECRFDNEPLAPCTSPVSANLREGIHTFHVQAQDSSGAIGTDSRLWNVDCLPPQIGADSFATYHMDEASGDTLINSTPYPAAEPPRHGTLETGSPAHKPVRVMPGRFGTGALRFPAIAADDAGQIQLGVPLVGPVAMDVGAHALELWLRPRLTFTHNELRLLNVGGSTTAGYFHYEIDLVPSGAQVRVRLSVSGGEEVVESQPIALDAYHYVAFSYTPGTRPFLFVDGVKTELSRTIDGLIASMTLNYFGPL